MPILKTAPIHTRYASRAEIERTVGRILREPLDERPSERPNRCPEVAVDIIRRMSKGGSTNAAIARELRICDLDRIQRARELLDCASEAAPEPTDAEHAAGFAQFVEDPEPPEAA